MAKSNDFESEWKRYCESKGGGAVTMNVKDVARHFYEQAIEDAIAYLKANAEKYIVDCTPTYPDAPQELIIGGMLYEHLRQSLTDD